jgi:hypothetical protein
LSDLIEALIAEFARHSPGWDDDLLVIGAGCGLRSSRTPARTRVGAA